MNKLALKHLRLWISVIAGAAIFFLLPHYWSAVSRVLVSWNCGVALFLVLIYVWMTHLNARQICLKFIEEDETAPVILVICILAALLSLVAIVALLSTLKQTSGADRAAHVALAALTVLNSWTLVPTMFTLHYADMFYSVTAEERPLHFPQTPEPVFGDFAYFSFTIAAACQTADVSTTNRSIRKVVAAHSVISFLFNAAILGFAINVTAGLIGGN
jgi:uncharacterized membrane protein